MQAPCQLLQEPPKTAQSQLGSVDPSPLMSGIAYLSEY